MKKRSFYELSVIDDFGNGTREYFYTDENTIRKLTHTRYTREKKKASSGGRDCDMHQNEPLFAWNCETSTGHVIQHCGFTTRNDVQWKKLDLGRLNRYKKSLYLLKDVGHFMVVEHINVYSSLRAGLNALKEYSSKAAKNWDLVKEDEDGNRLTNGQVRHIKKGRCITEYLCPYHTWEKTSYEYDEWDITATGYILLVKPVKFK